MTYSGEKLRIYSREFCKLKNIPIRNNRIQPRHFGEIHNFLKKLHTKNHKFRTWSKPQAIKEIMRGVGKWKKNVNVEI